MIVELLVLLIVHIIVAVNIQVMFFNMSLICTFVAGRNRLYFHSRNILPIQPSEFDENSDDEIDPDWLREYTERMMDEFTDVNDGEKAIMKLWNLFNLKYRSDLHSHHQLFILINI